MYLNIVVSLIYHLLPMFENVEHGGLGVIILASGSDVRGFDPG